MTVNRKIAFTLALVLSALMLQSCCWHKLHFSGRVVDKKGNAIPEATVAVGEKKVETDKNGSFDVCVPRAERYVLNVSKPDYGFVSKVYPDTISRLVITMAKAKTFTMNPNTDIVLQETQPDIVMPGGTTTTASTPLDTIPFVFDAKGNLVSFTKPPSLAQAQNSITNFQPPVLGARIEIPAGSLVLEGTDNKPQGDVTLSLNTVDLYAADGMPGNYSVNFREGRKTIGYMIPYGAANIEAYYQGKPLQLSGGRKATLTIPVDTFAIINRDSLPAQIPLLVYNRTTGLWDIDGSADLNAERTAYTTQVSHFSTYNMDLYKTDPSCVQMCLDIQPSSSLRITASYGSRTNVQTMAFPNVPCADPTECVGYGINGANTVGIINLPNDVPATVEVMSSGSTLTTYVINSGPFPGGSSYQACNFDNCAGPYRISDKGECWETTDGSGNRDGTMRGPVIAVTRSGGGIGDDFTLSWLFIRSITGGAIANGNVFYRVEYGTDTDFSDTQFVQFPAGGGSVTEVIQSTDWKVEPGTVAIAGLSPVVYFRVQYSTDGTNYVYGATTCVNCASPLPQSDVCSQTGNAVP